MQNCWLQDRTCRIVAASQNNFATEYSVPSNVTCRFAKLADFVGALHQSAVVSPFTPLPTASHLLRRVGIVLPTPYCCALAFVRLPGQQADRVSSTESPVSFELKRCTSQPYSLSTSFDLSIKFGVVISFDFISHRLQILLLPSFAAVSPGQPALTMLI